MEAAAQGRAGWRQVDCGIHVCTTGSDKGIGPNDMWRRYKIGYMKQKEIWNGKRHLSTNHPDILVNIVYIRRISYYHQSTDRPQLHQLEMAWCIEIIDDISAIPILSISYRRFYISFSIASYRWWRNIRSFFDNFVALFLLSVLVLLCGISSKITRNVNVKRNIKIRWP